MKNVHVYCAAATAALVLMLRKKRAERKQWVDAYLRDRALKGRYATSFEDLVDNPQHFRRSFHMSPEAFEELYSRVERHLLPKSRTRPDAIHPRERLIVTIEFLVTGCTARHLASTYRIAESTLHQIFMQVMEVIIAELKSGFMAFTDGNWLDTTNKFNYRWNLPNCLGAIDGKHFPVVCPK